MSTLDEQLALWPQQIPAREELGERFTEPRPVDHFAYFRRKSDAAAAASALQELGFAVTVNKSGMFKSALQATRSEPLTDESVRAFLSAVIAAVEAAGGEYDGWGAPVVTPDA